MDKGKLIKEINTLHSLVKATRIHIINKLKRDNKVWAAKATANSSNRRAKRKAESSEAILNHIKSIPPSVLIQEVLQYQPLKNDESWESTPLAHRSMARFLQDQKLKRYLKSLENQLGADATSKLLVALQQKRKIKSSVAKKQRKERIKKVLENKQEKRKEQRKRTGLAKTKAEVTNKLKTDGADSSHGTDDEDIERTSVCDSYVSDDDSEGFKEHKEQLESKESEYSKESDQQRRLSISVSEYTDDSSGEEAINHCVEEPQGKTNGTEKRNNPPRLSKPSIEKSDTSVTQIVKNPNKKKKVNYKAPEEEDEIDGYEMITDSFFVTDTGERYVAVAPKLKPQTEDDSEGDDIKESWKIMNTRKRKDQQPDEIDNTEAFGTGLKQAKQRKLNNSTKGKFTINEKSYTSGSSSVQNQDLHPSWAAKQAQKGIKPFAGKKVVFDADDDNGNSLTYTQKAPATFGTRNDDIHPSWAAKQAQKGIKPFAGKKVVFDAANNNDVGRTVSKKSFDRSNDLHPSWAAKQAQSGIKSFTGKKTVFNDEGKNGGDKTNGTMKGAPKTSHKNDLHPSWAAKQAQKGIKPFAGKKITFNTADAGIHDKPYAIKLSASAKASKSSDLHPSWAAKQAQKAILPFAGKKITFGNEDSAQNKTTVTGFRTGSAQGGSKHYANSNGGPKSQPNNSASLHPSWAAKQAQSGIKPFAGSKISFDD